MKSFLNNLEEQIRSYEEDGNKYIELFTSDAKILVDVAKAAVNLRNDPKYKTGLLPELERALSELEKLD